MDGNYEDIPMKKQQVGIMIGMMRIIMDEKRKQSLRISYYDNIMIIISKIKYSISYSYCFNENGINHETLGLSQEKMVIN